MTLFLDFFWLCALVLGAPYIAVKLATTPRWRVGLLERFGIRLPPRGSGRPVIWVHAVSVGEVLASRPLIRELERELPGHEVVISTITSTGLEVARKHFPQNRSFFYPIDMTIPVTRLLEAVRPSMIVLVELELWPTFLLVAQRMRIPVAVVNGRISERSFRRYRLVRRLLTRPIARFCAQGEEYARRFRGLGVPADRVTITGNLKYDTPALEGDDDPVAAALAQRKRLGIAPGAPVMVGGSTHPGEERALLDAYRAIRREQPDLRLILGPRHLERLGDVLADCEAAGVPVLRKTEIDRAPPHPDPLPPGEGAQAVIVIDTLGDLARIYRAADVVFVGGSLIPHGGQNMLEPAALGKPVLMGPHVRNFRAIAEELVNGGAAETVPDAAALERSLRALLLDPGRARAMGERGRAVVERHRGAAQRTVRILKDILGPAAALPRAGQFREQATATVRV